MKRASRILLVPMTCLAISLIGCGKRETPAPAVVESRTESVAKQPKQPVPAKETGTVKVELRINDPTAVLSIDGDEYTPGDLSQPLTLPVGEHTAILRFGDQELRPRKIQVVSGKRTVLQLVDPNREAAEWAIRIGANELRIAADGQERQVKSVAELPQSAFEVVYIAIIDKPVSDEDMGRVEGLYSLHDLRLMRTGITDRGLSHLRGLPSLDFLVLDGNKITDAGLVYLKDLPKLRFVDLLGNKITDAGLAHLKGIDLRGLRLDETEVTDAGLVHLSGMINLDLLNLSGTKVTDTGLVHLQGIKHLRDLGLARTKISDAGLAHLKVLPRLGILSLHNTTVSDAGIADLKTVLPNCTVHK